MKKSLSIISLLIALFSIPFLAHSSTPYQSAVNNSSHSIDKTINKTFNDILEINCQGEFFDVLVHSGNSDETSINAVIQGEFKTFVGTDNFDIDLKFDKQKSKLFISVIEPNGLNVINSTKCVIQITTPKGTNLVIKTNSGNIVAKNFKTHKINLSANSGEILSENLSAKIPLEIRTTSGDIKLSNSNAPEMLISSTSGEVTANNIHADFNCKTTSGDIKADQIFGVANLKSTSGQVKSSQISGGLTSKSTSGNQFHSKIESFIKATGTSGDISLFHIDGLCSAKTVSGEIDINDSNGEFKIRSNSGQIKCTGIEVNANSTFNSNSGDVYCRLRNEPSQVSFQLLSTSGDLNAGRINKDRKLYTESGNLLIKGNTTSGDQTFVFIR